MFLVGAPGSIRGREQKARDRPGATGGQDRWRRFEAEAGLRREDGVGRHPGSQGGPAGGLWAPASVHVDGESRCHLAWDAAALWARARPLSRGGLGAEASRLGTLGPLPPRCETQTRRRPQVPFLAGASLPGWAHAEGHLLEHSSGTIPEIPDSLGGLGGHRPAEVARLYRQRAPSAQRAGCPGSFRRPERPERPERRERRERRAGRGAARAGSGARGGGQQPRPSLPPPPFSFLSFLLQSSRCPVSFASAAAGGRVLQPLLRAGRVRRGPELHARGWACPEPAPGPGRSGRAD